MSINTPTGNPSTSLWNQLNWRPSTKQLDQFVQLQSLLKDWNNQVNLTRLTEGNDYWISQVFDSLWPFKNELQDPAQKFTCVDVGSGCGFPGLAVAIALPKTQITLVESVSRKTKILEKISKEIGLDSRTLIVNERVEITAHRPNFRRKFDIAIARAVANAPIVAEYLIPFLNSQGEALIYRGKWSQSNNKELTTAVETLNANIKEIIRIDLPDNRGERHVIRVKPQKVCAKIYPRSVGTPTKKPLGS